MSEEKGLIMDAKGRGLLGRRELQTMFDNRKKPGWKERMSTDLAIIE